MFSDAFRNRMLNSGSTRTERLLNIKTREFNKYFDETLNKEACLIDNIPSYAVFQDHSQSNNKDLSDDKYVIVPNSVDVGVGSYIQWRDSNWLVFTEEVKTIPTHQQLKIKHVNKQIKWITCYDDHAICNNGKGWGAYVENQTLYTLGVSFSGKHMALANAKVMLYVQDNEETRKLKTGTRLYIGGNIYKIEFADYVSRTGLINCLLDEDTFNSDIDNMELGIADYWKPLQKNESESNDDTLDELALVGETRVKLGKTYVYKLNNESVDLNISEWIFNDIESLPFHILERTEKSATIRIKDDYRYVGQQSNVMCKVNGQVVNLTINIINKFA